MEFEAIGTHWWIESALADEQINRVHTLLEKIDKTWSRFRDDSMVMTMSQMVGEYPLSKPDVALLNWYHRLFEATDGLVTPLIGQTMSDAGYDQHYSLQPKSKINKTPDWDKVIKLGEQSITIKQPWLIDVGAAGKGYAVDRVAELLGDDYCVDASGDIKVGGRKMKIGLEDPRDPSKLIGVASIQNESICGSAVNRRAWGDWHHVINPKSSSPVSDIIATWVISDNAMQADGLATALFFVAPAKLQHLAPFRYCIMYKDGGIKMTNDKTITIFTEDK